MENNRYANAELILPPELFKEVQKYHSGLLWIPSKTGFYKERHQLVIALSQQGIAAKEIANLAGISRRRVNQILAEQKKV